MILAAYMVAGFLVASIYAVGMLKGRRDRLHRLGLLIPLTIACIATPIQLFVGDTAAREVADHQPAKFAGDGVHPGDRHPTRPSTSAASAPTTGSRAAIGIPGLDSFLVGFSTDTEVDRARRHPARRAARPPTPCCTSPSTRWSGSASALLALGAWLAFVWWRKRDIPQTPWFLRAVAVSRRRRRSSRSGAAGSSPRSAASPGSSRATCAPTKRSPRRTGSGSAFAGRAAALRGARHDRDPRPARDVAPLARGRTPRTTRAPPTRRRSTAGEAGRR